MREAERRGLVKTYTIGLIDRAYLPDEHIELGIAAQEHESEAPDREDAPPVVSSEPRETTATVGSMTEEELAHLHRLVGFLDELEHNSPYMSFNFMAERAYETSGLPLTISEIAALLNTAIEDGVFTRDTRTVWNRATNEYRDINIFRLNRSNQLVSEALAANAVPG
jgi:hypothetical protein